MVEFMKPGTIINGDSYTIKARQSDTEPKKRQIVAEYRTSLRYAK